MSTSPVLICALFLFLSVAIVHSSMEILQPKGTSLWIANGKTRKVVFSYTGKKVDSWVVTLHDLHGKMIHSYPADILFPEKSGGKTIFKKQAVVPDELDTGEYTVEVCGFAQEERLLCRKSEVFQVEGHQRKHNSDDKLEPHEKRYQAHIDALEDHLRKLDVQDVWPVNETQCTIPRIHRPTKDEFINKCMGPAQACIVSGMMDQWKAMNKWRFEVFQHDPRIDEGVLIGQRTQSIPLSRYVWYLNERAMNDTSPWSVFMSEVFDFYPVLREDYTVPDIFSESDDFLTGLDESLRLDWRWIIMAAKRSGSGWHVDPANTTGWLALIQGAKLWGMYPPSVDHVPGVKANFYQRRDYEAEDAFYWWIYTRPYLKSNLPIECVQKPGDIVYIPSGWWHSVLNLENTVSVTQNFCNKYSLRICLTELREQADSDGGFIGKTFEQLRELYSRDYPQYFVEQDYEFEAPMEGDGLTEAEEASRKLQNLKDFFFGKSASIE